MIKEEQDKERLSNSIQICFQILYLNFQQYNKRNKPGTLNNIGERYLRSLSP